MLLFKAQNVTQIRISHDWCSEKQINNIVKKFHMFYSIDLESCHFFLKDFVAIMHRDEAQFF